MKAAQWIDRLKENNGWESDYRVAKELDLNRATVSLYRTKQSTFDEETALKVALLLEMDPAILLVDQAAERTKNLSAREALMAFLRSFGLGDYWPWNHMANRPMTVAENESYGNESFLFTAAMRRANSVLGHNATLAEVVAEAPRYKYAGHVLKSQPKTEVDASAAGLSPSQADMNQSSSNWRKRRDSNPR